MDSAESRPKRSLDEELSIDENKSTPPSKKTLKSFDDATSESPEASDAELLETLKNNYGSWKAFKRTTIGWAFWETIGQGKSSQGGAVQCIVCTKYPHYYAGVKHTTNYKERSGTSVISGHPTKYHPALLAMLTETKEEKKKEKKPLPSLFSKLTASQTKHSFQAGTVKWKESDPRQQRWIENQILCFARSYHPLSEVEDPDFIAHWLSQLPNLNIPARRDFRLIHIPEMAKRTLNEFVLPHLEAAQFVAITYDLWMTYGTKNVFAVNCHSLVDHEGTWQRRITTLGLVKIKSTEGSTSGKQVCKSLMEVLARFPGLDAKIVGDVSDGGSNLEVLRRESAQLHCHAFPSLKQRFGLLCNMHIYGGCIKAALNPEENRAAALGADTAALKKKVVSAVTWPRKSEPARCVWNDRAQAHNLSPRLPPAPVPTRPTSLIEFYEEVIKYRPVLDELYNPAYNQRLLTTAGKRNRRLTDDEWDILNLMVQATLPTKIQYYTHQSEGYWSLSDAIAANLQLYLSIRDSDDDTENNLSTMSEMAVLKANMKVAIAESLLKHMGWLRQFEESTAACMLALMLDHRHKSLALVAAFFRGVQGVNRDVLQKYDNLLLAMMRDVHRYPGKGDAAAPEAPGDTLRWGEIFEPSKSEASDSLVEELVRFRALLVPPEEKALSPLLWWPKNVSRFPNLAVVARAILTMPGSQNDVERLFSVAGYLASARRNAMSTEMLEELVLINKNYPQRPISQVSKPQGSLEEQEEELARLLERGPVR